MTMTASVSLTPKQKEFVARACAFIDSAPPRDEIEKLLTLAALQLPESVVEMLARRAGIGRTGGDPPAPSLH